MNEMNVYTQPPLILAVLTCYYTKLLTFGILSQTPLIFGHLCLYTSYIWHFLSTTS